MSRRTKRTDRNTVLKKWLIILVIFALIVLTLRSVSWWLEDEGYIETRQVQGVVIQEKNVNMNVVAAEFSDEENLVYNYLRQAGMTVAGACGVMGNIAIENPGYVADLSANNGATYGLFQWMDEGNRKNNLVTWCNQQVIYPNRIDGQIAFMLYEIKEGDSIALPLYDYLQHVDSPVMAAMEFACGFERCVGYTRSGCDGIYQGNLYPSQVGQVYQGLQGRMDHAQKYYDVYSKLEATTNL